MRIYLLSANPTKWPDTLKEFVGFCQRFVLLYLTILWGWRLKPVSAIFYQIFIFHQMIALPKL